LIQIALLRMRTIKCTLSLTEKGRCTMKKSILISVILTISCLTGCTAKSSYSKEQAMVKKGYEAIKDTLLDPESMIVYDCYAWTAKSDELQEADWAAKRDETEAELPDDLLSVYYHVGARNRMGGMTEAQYIILYDPETGAYKASGEKEEVDEAVQAFIDGDEDAIFDRDVQGQFLNVEFWQLLGWPESATDYEEFIKSEEFEKVDVKKILGN